VLEDVLFMWRNCPNPAYANALVKFLDHMQLDTPYFVGLLWKRDRPFAETST